MKRALRIILGLVGGVAILLGGTWLLARGLSDREQLYQGKPSDYWAGQLNSSDAAVSNRANAVLNSEIIPHLTSVMMQDTTDSGRKLRLITALEQLPGVTINSTKADGRREAATIEMGLFGPPARAAVPALLQVLKGNDDVVRGRAATALGRIHADPEIVIPALLACLTDSENDPRAEAAEALGNYGDKAKAAVPHLLGYLGNTKNDKALWAAVPNALKSIDHAAAAKAGVK